MQCTTPNLDSDMAVAVLVSLHQLLRGFVDDA